jgi:phage shock protein C
MSLHKSKKSRVLFGVCGGLSENTGIDVSLLRIGFLLGAIFTGSILFWFYLVLALVLPTQD